MIINMTKNCEKSQLTRKIVRLAIFRNTRKSQFLLLRANLDISDFELSQIAEYENYSKSGDINVVCLCLVSGLLTMQIQ